jgi:hypothetical protein
MITGRQKRTVKDKYKLNSIYEINCRDCNKAYMGLTQSTTIYALMRNSVTDLA